MFAQTNTELLAQQQHGHNNGRQLRMPGDPDSFTRCKPYLAHFYPVFSRFLRVFTVSPRRFQRAQNRNPGPRNSRQEGRTPKR